MHMLVKNFNIAQYVRLLDIEYQGVLLIPMSVELGFCIYRGISLFHTGIRDFVNSFILRCRKYYACSQSKYFVYQEVFYYCVTAI